MGKEVVLTEQREKIWIVTLNRPERLNAINHDWKLGMERALSDVETDKKSKVIIFKGAGRAFCVGGDLRALQEGDKMGSKEGLEISHTILQRLVDLPQIVISQVHGYAMGAGMSLVMASDLTYAAEGTQFSLPFLKIGLIPDWGALYFLPRLATLKRAKEILFLGKIFGTDMALELGLINGVYPAGRLEQEVEKTAIEIAFSNGFEALRETKRILNRSLGFSLTELLQEEMTSFLRCQSHPDYAEGLIAFKQKRKPNFA